MAITKMMNIRNSKAHPRKAGKHLINALNYITNPEKTKDGLYVGAVNCLANPKSAFIQMSNTKKALNKNGCRQAYHFVLSCPPEEGSPKIMMEITEKFIKEYLKDKYEVLYAVHDNTEKMHSHLIFNSVSFVTGKKYEYKNGDWKKSIQPIVNKLCEEYGLSSIELDDYDTDKNKKGEENKSDKKINHREQLQKDINDAIERCSSYDEFLQIMKNEKEYKINYGKYLSMKSKIGLSYIRVKSLGELYTEDMIKLKISMKKGKFKKYSYKKISRAKIVWTKQRHKKINYKEMSSYQKWVFRKFMKQKQLKRNTYAANTWKYKEDVKSFKKVQEEYLFIINNKIKKPADLYILKNKLEKERFSLINERRIFNQEGKLYAEVIEQYNRLKELEVRHFLYLDDDNKTFKKEYDEYIEIKNQITLQGYDLKDLNTYMKDVYYKKDEFKNKSYYLNRDIKILERLVLKDNADEIYKIYNLKESNENVEVKESENFNIWSKSLVVRSYEFARVFNHNTENDYSKENNYIICDRLNPLNYIIVKSERDVFDNEEYTKSSYYVYKNNEFNGEFNDGRFKGRAEYYWYDLRNRMKNISGMKDDNVIFNNEENYKKYCDAYIKSKDTKERNPSNEEDSNISSSYDHGRTM